MMLPSILLWLTSLFLPSAIPQGFIAAGGPTITVTACGAGTAGQTGTAQTSVTISAPCSTSTGDVLAVETRVGNGGVTITAPTVTGATASCTLATASNSSSLDAGGASMEWAYCPVTAGNASTNVTCNFTSIPYVSCVVGIAHGATGHLDTAQFSSAYASTATTNDLGTSLFTTTHANAAVFAGMTQNNNTNTFSSGNIAGSAATLLQTSAPTNSGDTGTEYRVLGSTVSGQDAALNINAAENDLVVNMMAVY